MRLPPGFKLECDYIILKNIEKRKALDKINRKLQQKAEKARVQQEEKDKKKQGKQRDGDSKRPAHEAYAIGDPYAEKPLHTLAHDMAA